VRAEQAAVIAHAEMARHHAGGDFDKLKRLLGI
jgi:hypothetical protein